MGTFREKLSRIDISCFCYRLWEKTQNVITHNTESHISDYTNQSRGKKIWDPGL